MPDSPQRKPLKFTLQPAKLLAMIRRAARESRNVNFGQHAIDRMDERGITTLDVFRVLKTGDLKGLIEPGNRAGEWKCKIVQKIKGSREVGVVSIYMSSGRIFIKTVEWEDLR